MVKVSIGVITHTPYMNNYTRLINELLKQIEGETDIEIISLVQLEKEENQLLVKNKEPKLKQFVIYDILSPPKARNYILENACGDWIAFIDGDCQVGENYISSLRKSIQNLSSDIFGVQGTIYAKDISKYGKYEFYYDIISLIELDVCEAKKIFKSRKGMINENVKKCYKEMNRNYVRKFQGFNFVISKKAIEKVGKFNCGIETAEDREYSARLNAIGGKILLEKDLAVYHDYNMTLPRILKRKKWHALGCAYLRKKYGEVYDTHKLKRMVYALSIFFSCKKVDYLLYQIMSDCIFWRNVKVEMKRWNDSSVR